MPSNTAKLNATVWALMALASGTYGALYVPCPCGTCRVNGRVLFRNDTALRLFVLTSDLSDAAVRSLIARATTRHNMRHVAADDNSALFLGCADDNNRRQRNADVPMTGTTLYALADAVASLVTFDATVRAADDQRVALMA